MANCVDTLEAILGSADCKLDSILYQLEHKLCQVDGDGGDVQSPDGQPVVMSCSQMIADLKTVRQDIQVIRDEHKQLQHMQKNMSDQLSDKCKDLETKVIQLKHNLNYQ